MFIFQQNNVINKICVSLWKQCWICTFYFYSVSDISRCKLGTLSFISRYYKRSYIFTNGLVDFKHNVTIGALPFLIFGKSEKSITLSRNSKYWFINRLLILSLNVKVKISSPVALVNHLLYPPEFFITLFQLSLSTKNF